MGAVLGGRATVAATLVLVLFLRVLLTCIPATPVIVEDNALIGANAVVIEGIRALEKVLLLQQVL